MFKAVLSCSTNTEKLLVGIVHLSSTSCRSNLFIYFILSQHRLKLNNTTRCHFTQKWCFSLCAFLTAQWVTREATSYFPDFFPKVLCKGLGRLPSRFSLLNYSTFPNAHALLFPFRSSHDSSGPPCGCMFAGVSQAVVPQCLTIRKDTTASILHTHPHSLPCSHYVIRP